MLLPAMMSKELFRIRKGIGKLKAYANGMVMDLHSACIVVNSVPPTCTAHVAIETSTVRIQCATVMHVAVMIIFFICCANVSLHALRNPRPTRVPKSRARLGSASFQSSPSAS